MKKAVKNWKNHFFFFLVCFLKKTNLSRFISFSDDSGLIISESEIDDILAIHSLPVSISSAHLNFDRALIKKFTLEQPKNEQARTLSLLLDFSTVIDTDPENCEFSVCLRQLVSIGYFMPQLIRRNQMKFLDCIKIIVERIQNEYPHNRHFGHQYAAALAYVLSPLTKRICDVDIASPIYSVYNDILNLLLGLYNNDEFMTTKEMPKIVPFFFNSIMVFKGDSTSNYTDEQLNLLNHLIMLLIKFTKQIDTSTTIKFQTAINHIFQKLFLMPLPIQIGLNLLDLILSLCKFDENILNFAFDQNNSLRLIKFFVSLMKLISFDNLHESSILDNQANYKLNGNFEIIDHPIDRTFETDIPIIQVENKIQKNKEQIKLPAYIYNNKTFVSLLNFIQQFCSFKSTTFPSAFHNQLINEIINDSQLGQMTVFPIFLSVWVYKFIDKGFDSLSSVFHQTKYFTHLYYATFIRYDEVDLQEFVLNIISFLFSKYHSKNLYYFCEFLQFTLDFLNELTINPMILDCLFNCSVESSSTFVDASSSVKMSSELYRILSEMIYKSQTVKDPNLINTRRLLLIFLEKINNNPRIFQYFFSDFNFTNCILTHFYDDSTFAFASYLLQLFFEQMPFQTYSYTIIVQFLNKIDISTSMLITLIKCCTSGFDNNPFEILNLLNKSNLIDLLVSASVKHNYEQALPIFLSLFSKITNSQIQFTFNFDLFLKLKSLVNKDFNTMILWNIVFGDFQEGNESEVLSYPKKIINSSPISLLFEVYILKDEVKQFVDFINECMKLDSSTILNLAKTELPSMLLNYISQYRKMDHEDKEFKSVLDFFKNISLASLQKSDFVSLFRLCSPLPNGYRPFFSLDIINIIKQLIAISKTKHLSCYYLNGFKTYLQLPDIPLEIINGGFTFYCQMKFLSQDFEGSLLEFMSDQSGISIKWIRDHLDIAITNNSKRYNFQWPLNIRCQEIIKIAFNWFPKKLVVYFNMDYHEFSHESIVFDTPFSYFSAFKNVPCNVYRFFMFKRIFNDLKLLSQIPPSYITSFHSSETSHINKVFWKLFQPSIAPDILFLFNASISFNNFSVCMVNSTTMRVNGKIVNVEPHPLVLLDSIGGVPLLLPFLEQIDMQTIDGQIYTPDTQILPTLLGLFERSLENNAIRQIEFKIFEGCKMLSYLLSRISLKHLQLEHTIDSLCSIFKKSCNSLALEMIDSILFNFQLWIYLPIDVQKQIYNKFYLAIQKKLQVSQKPFLHYFNISKLLMLVRLYFWDIKTNKKICLSDDSKYNILTHEIEGQRPSDCSNLREFFYEIIKQLSTQYLHIEDIDLIVSFCCNSLDLDFAKEALNLFIYLIQTKNEKVVEYMKREHSFTPFIKMFKVPDSKILNQIFSIFINLDPSFMKPFNEKELLSGILNEICSTAIDINFINTIRRSMIRTREDHLSNYDIANLEIYNHKFIPFYLLALQSLGDNLNDKNIMMKYFDVIDDLMKMGNRFPDTNWDHPFLFLIMCQSKTELNHDSEIVNNCINLLAFLYNKSLRGDNPLPNFFQLQNFVQLMSYQCKKDFSYIIRRIYTELLKKENINERPYTPINIKTFIKIYLQIAEFILIIPKFNCTNTNTNFSYQDLYKISQKLIPNETSDLNYSSYSIRIIDDIWKDKELASLLIDSLISRSKELIAIKNKQTSKKNDNLQPIELLGVLIQNGLNMPLYTKEYIDYADQTLAIFLEYDHLRTAVRKCILHIFYGLKQSADMDIRKGDNSSFDFLIEKTKQFAEYLQKEVKVNIPQKLLPKEKINRLDKSVKKDQSEKNESSDKGENTEKAEDLDSIDESPKKKERKEKIKKLKNDEISMEMFSPIDESQTMSEINLKKLTLKEIERKQETIKKISSALEFNIELIQKLKHGEMSREISLINNLEQFALLRKNDSIVSMKKYIKKFRELSSNDGPWQSYETQPKRFRKLGKRIFHGCRFFMKTNYKYTDHKDASILRDVGNANEARELIEKQYAKSKMLNFQGDAAIFAADKQNLRSSNTLNDNIILKCDSRNVTMKDVKTGKLSITKTYIAFDSSDSFIQINLESITKIFLRRYLLQDSAIEIFVVDKKSFFFDFPGDQRKLVLEELKIRNLPNIKFLQMTHEDIIPLLNSTTQKWQSRKLTNFEYLMKLNCYAGRTYNDLSQYPVFPWIIADYSSPELNLSAPETFRDLTKPVGAIGQERLAQLQERASQGSDDLSTYLYGSFYSSSAYVIGYLIRMEPFTTLHIKLQNNKFDHGDRLFVSIPKAWESATHSAMDFRELTPEFFYSPDFLVNENNFDLGIYTSTNEKINDVELPKWSKNPTDFVYKNREALETPFTTLSLNYWIDLIFGVNSRLPNSRAVNNVFHPYYYETAIEGKSGKELEIIQEYAACFGSAPIQLFKEPHPLRQISPVSFKNVFFGEEKNLILDVENPIVALSTDLGDNIAISSNHDFYMGSLKKGHLNLNVPTELEEICREGQKIGVNSYSAAVSLPWDCAVYIFNFENVKSEPIYIAREHSKKITSISMTEKYLATGSLDCTVKIWDCKRNKILYTISKHKTPISALEINEKLRVCVVASTDGYVTINSLITGETMSSVNIGLESPSFLNLSNIGCIVIAQNTTSNKCRAAVYDSNLKVIVKEKLFKSKWICAKIISWDDGVDYIAISTTKSEIQFRKLPFLEKIHPKIETRYTVSSLAFHKDQNRLIIGDSKGSVHCHRFIQ